MQKKRILVLGFYNRGNLGDDCYHYMWSQIFRDRYPEFHVNFESIDDCDGIDADVCILGGGSILNDYFIDKIHKAIDATNFKGPI